MAQTAAIVDVMKRRLREHGLTYADVARALDLSEASVKRLFSERQFSLRRLDQICALMGLEISELVRELKPEPRIQQLTLEQEQELVSDTRLLLVAVCGLNRWQLAEIQANYCFSETEVIGYLARLDRMGLVELLPGNRIKPLVGHDFTWLKNGPIQRFIETDVQPDFFQCGFTGPGELRLFLNGMVSTHSSETIHQKMRRLAQDFLHAHQEDQGLPLGERFGVSLMVAIRPWELAVFAQYRRPEAMKPYPERRKLSGAGL